MQIGGFLPTSLIDFPGCVAAVVFTRGCNFRCPYCHNPDLVMPTHAAQRKWTSAAVLERLGKRRGLLDGVVVTGGEPTLHRDLPAFLRRVKELGFRIKLDTNGSRPHVLEDLINEKLADYIAMDVKAPWRTYHTVAGADVDTESLAASIRLIRDSGISHEFRTTAVRPLHTRDDLLQIGEMLRGADRLVLQRFVSGRLLDPAFARVARPFSEEELQAIRVILLSRGIECVVR